MTQQPLQMNVLQQPLPIEVQQQAGMYNMGALTALYKPRFTNPLVIITEWNEFKSLDMVQIRSAMHRPVLIDGRNVYEPLEMNRLGFIYRGMGRATGPAPSVLPSGDSTSLLQQQETISISMGDAK